MNMRQDIKPALWGAAGGAILLALVGFAWGGWQTAAWRVAHPIPMPTPPWSAYLRRSVLSSSASRSMPRPSSLS